jgi:Abortive infection C-terminus
MMFAACLSTAQLSIRPTPCKKADFNYWHLARERLGLHPSHVDASTIGGEVIRKILQSSWMIAEQVNVLRGLQGTRHGRTVPTGVSPRASHAGGPKGLQRRGVQVKCA